MALSVRLTARDNAALLALAEAEGVAPNELARRLIHDHLRKVERRGRAVTTPMSNQPDAG
jgi:hypothetical protein